MSAGRHACVLDRGASVGVVAPGFAVKRAALGRGVRRLEDLGYRVVLGRHVLARDGYFAGSDADRAEDLNRMIRDPEVAAVWFARGGYGCARLIERIDWRALARRPKLLVGYSDATALFAAAHRRGVAPCLYAPVVTELGDPRAYDAASLRRLLGGRPVRLPLSRRRVLRHGRARGVLLGGNLTVLAHLLGTPHMPDLRGAVLFVEDVSEPAYRLDRLLHHLRQSGAADGVAAALVGSFEPVGRGRPDRTRTVTEMLEETFLPLGVPVVAGLRAGHAPRKRTLALGAAARLDTRAGVLEMDPSRTGRGGRSR